MSANDKHPNGLANGSDQVGRNYMYHNSAAVLAISKEPNPTVFQKTLGLNDFYFGMSGFRIPDGQHSDGRQVAGPDVSKARSRSRPGWRRCWRSTKWHSTPWTSGSPPRICRCRTIASRWSKDGNISLSYTPNNQAPKQKLYDKLKSMLNHLGMHPDHLIPRNLYMKNEIGIGGVAHQAGTCRFGTDPQHVGAGRQLQGARIGQPLCRGHQLFPEHRRGEPRADRHGERAPRRRSSARTDQVTTQDPMAQRREIAAVYVAGLVQGLALVTFPAASTIFTDPQHYGLSSTEYGAHVCAPGDHGGWFVAAGRGVDPAPGHQAHLSAWARCQPAVDGLARLRASLSCRRHAVAYSMLLAGHNEPGRRLRSDRARPQHLRRGVLPAKVDSAVLVLNALLGLRNRAGAGVCRDLCRARVSGGGCRFLSRSCFYRLLLFSLPLPLQTGTDKAATRP